MRSLSYLFAFCLVVSSTLVSASAQTPSEIQVADEETPSFVASRPAPAATVVAPSPVTTAAVVQLAPVGLGDVDLGNVIPASGMAEITPAAPRLATLVANASYQNRSASLRVNSGFGVRRDPFSGAARMHTGVDLKASQGQRVGASLAGTVVYAGQRGGYGNLVVVDHGRGIATMYGHLSAIDVTTGQRVVTGQTVGQVGSTGRSTGPHLHYEVRARGHAVDPSSLITFDGASVFANGKLVEGPIVEGGDERIAKAKPGEKAPAPLPPLPIYETADGLSNSY